MLEVCGLCISFRKAEFLKETLEERPLSHLLLNFDCSLHSSTLTAMTYHLSDETESEIAY